MLNVVLAVLGSFRLARIITSDSISDSLRARVGRWAAGRSDYRWWVAELVTCPFCVGVWFSAFMVLLLKPPTVKQFILLWLGVSGGQYILQVLV